MKNIKKYVAAMLVLSLSIQPIQVNAEGKAVQEAVTEEAVTQDELTLESIEETTIQEEQTTSQEEIEVNNVDVEVQTAASQTTYETQDGFTYTLNENNEATITGCTAEHSNLVIPGTVDGHIVREIGQSAFEDDTTIAKLSISENVETIGYFAFSCCLNMKELQLPSTIKKILNYAFELGKFTEVEIPEGCECIAIGAFESNVMHEITIPKSVTRIGYNEKTLENKQEEILLGSTGERIIGYAGSAAETYANSLGKIFVNIEWKPLEQFVLPENIQLSLNERVKFPISFIPNDAYSVFTKIDGFDTVNVTDEGEATASIYYEVVDGVLYITPTEEGVAGFSVYKNAVKNYMPNFLRSNICKITVVDPSKINATSITLKDGNNNTINDTTLVYDTYNTGYSYSINLETNPLNANEDITFTSTNESLAKVTKVDGKYVLTLQRGYFETPHTCTITATGKRSGITSTFDVSVFYGGAESIAFDTSFSNNKNGRVNRIVQNSEYTMPIKVVPETLAKDSTITITQNPQIVGQSVITYDKDTSKLKAIGVGTATIKVECKGKSISYDFEVEAYENKATSVTISTNDKVTKTDTGYSLSLNLNDTYQLKSTVLPEDTTDILKWREVSNSGVVSIDAQGNISTLKAGTATIKATSCSYLEEFVANAQSEYVTVTVTNPNAVIEDPEPEEIIATDISLGQKSCTLTIGNTLQLTTVVTPANTTDKVKYNTNNTSVATVSETGLLTIVGAGTARVGAEIRGMQCWITINAKAPITPPTMTLNTTTITLKKGETYTLAGTVTGNTHITSIAWDSENGNIATIKADGNIVTKGVGSTRLVAVIYCFESGEYYRSYCDVTVTGETTVITQPTVQNVTMNTTSISLSYGDSSTLNASLSPQGTTGTISWSSNNVGIATVSNGLVVAKGPGTCQISATCNGLTATCNVTVEAGTIQLNAGKFNLQKGKTTKALNISSSSYENDKIVSITSSDSKILSASFSGNQISLKGLKVSSKYVTVTVQTESGAIATSQVKVVKDKVTTSKLTLNKKTVTLSKGASETLTVTQTPISSTDKLTWSSSNKKIATVDKNGKIVAKKKGSATIELKSSNGKKVTCKVTVK